MRTAKPSHELPGLLSLKLVEPAGRTLKLHFKVVNLIPRGVNSGTNVAVFAFLLGLPFLVVFQKLTPHRLAQLAP